MLKLLTIGWLALLCSALSLVTARTAPLAQARYELVEQAPLARLDTRFLNVLTLGFRGLYDDFATIFTVQMLVDERLRRTSEPDRIIATLRALTRHLPRIESLYMIGCFVLANDFAAPRLCEALTLDGMKAMPESWRIPVTQGFIFAHRLSDPKNAAVYYGLAASRPGAPAFLGKLTRNLIEKNQLDPGELQETLDGVLGARERSRFGEVLQPRRPMP